MLINTTEETGTQTTSPNSLSSLEQKRLDYPRWGYTFVGAYLLCVAMLGTLENLLTLYVFARNKKLRSPTNVFLMGVCFCDLCMAMLAVPFASAAGFAGRWNSGDAGCDVEAFVVYFFGLSSLYMLTAVSVDRYIVIAKPMHGRKITNRVAVVAVMGCVGGGLFWALLPVFGWNGYGEELSGVSCGLQYRDHSAASTAYIIAIFVFCFFLPACIMVFCYYNVYMTIRTVNKTTRGVMNDRIDRRNARVQRKLLKTCIALVATFLVCWLPYAIVSFWQAFGNLDSLPLTVTLLPAVAAKSQVVVNPVIFAATNQQFRQAFYRTVPCRGVRECMAKKETPDEEADDETPTNQGEANYSYSVSIVPINKTEPAITVDENPTTPHTELPP